ncbi:MAG TPA: beta-ribofuranosylaminobenzene 5'-phosphate synthase family protein [Candidatus Methylomirabilis sp.]|nr:beta-ribofuranosylaminobenzene 5'-phosphate synthase family protein [Candidatus Methylomirabilis sp.]
MRVTVRAPARLHFGFIDLDGSLGRMFGSIGLAIDEPRIILEATPSNRLSVSGDESGRAEALARRFLRHYRLPHRAHISIKETIPAHIGLGSGTQLALSVAAALARLFTIKAGVRELATVMGRGARSGIGVSAFEGGGFIVDAGRRISAASSSSGPGSLPPTIARHAFPEDWTFVVAIPHVHRGLAGNAESRAFRQITARPARGSARLSRILLIQMLPALVERDPAAFGRSLTSIQRIVGNWFRTVQGGTFATPQGATLAKAMAGAGALGVGQSSWGPTVYGMAADQEQANALEQQIRRAISGNIAATIFAVRGYNRGAEILS